MKRILLILAATVLLCGCRTAQEAMPQTVPSTESTLPTESTLSTEGTEPTIKDEVFIDFEITDPTPTTPTEPTPPATEPAVTLPPATEPEETTESTLPQTEGSGYFKPILRP